jgi:hypothetical protein
MGNLKKYPFIFISIALNFVFTLSSNDEKRFSDTICNITLFEAFSYIATSGLSYFT